MMSDNDIRKGFQSKLSSFEAPVPPDGWESVERSLQAASAARMILRRRWFAGSAAAVLVLLVGSLWFLRNSFDQTETIVSETKTPEIPVVIDAPQNNGEKIGIVPEVSSESQATPVENRLQDTNKSRQVKTRKEPAVRAASPTKLLAMLMEREQLSERKIDTALLRFWAKSAKRDALQNGKEPQSKEEVNLFAGDDILLAGGSASEKEREPVILSFGGKGGLSSYQQTVNTPMTLRSATAVDDSKNNVENVKLQSYASNPIGNTSVMEHDQPVSFGITVSKPILDNLSIETGLVYSYLHSKVMNSSNFHKEDQEQVLHYIGIPLNVNYNIFSLRKLNVYASIGGMVEKDIYGEFRDKSEQQSMSFNNTTDESETLESEAKGYEKISQKHPQFSVNAGVGLSYPIYDRLRLYGKIGGAYYFDAKNEHSTIYSDRKVVMDLNVGLRYEF